MTKSSVGLSTLQKNLLSLLRMKKPSTISDIANALKNQRKTRKKKKKDYDYTSIRRSWLALIKRGLIEAVGKYEYRGRQFPTYWLTVIGVFHAIVQGAPPTQTMQTAKKIHLIHAEDIDMLIDFIKEIGDEKFRKITEAYLNSDGDIKEFKFKNIPLNTDFTKRDFKATFKVMARHKTGRQMLQAACKALNEIVDELKELEEEG